MCLLYVYIPYFLRERTTQAVISIHNIQYLKNKYISRGRTMERGEIDLSLPGRDG